MEFWTQFPTDSSVGNVYVKLAPTESLTYRRIISFGKVCGIMKSHLTFFFPKFRNFPLASLTEITTPLPLSQKSPLLFHYLAGVVASSLPSSLRCHCGSEFHCHLAPPNSPRQLRCRCSPTSPLRCCHLAAAVASPLPSWVWVPRSKLGWVPRRSGSVFLPATAFVDRDLGFGEFNWFFFLPLLCC